MLIGAIATIGTEINREENAKGHLHDIYILEGDLLIIILEDNLTNEEKLTAVSRYIETMGTEIQMHYDDWMPVRYALIVLIAGNALFSIGLTTEILRKRDPGKSN
jgi:hypothetical protein